MSPPCAILLAISYGFLSTFFSYSKDPLSLYFFFACAYVIRKTLHELWGLLNVALSAEKCIYKCLDLVERVVPVQTG